MIFGSMFNRWPYTDLQNLNLDWLIGVCKDITTNWPPKFEEIENEINKKLDKALNDGTLGDILTNNGNGTYEWKPFDTAISNQIIQAVNNWLANHPEATTTVQDGAITPAKLDNELYSLYKDLGMVQLFIPPVLDSTSQGNCSLMVTPNSTILFDTHAEVNELAIINYLSELYNSAVFNNIDYIILSHYHYDHIENLEAILQNFPHNNCKIYIPLSPSGFYPAVIAPVLISNYDEVIRVANAYNLDIHEITSDTTITIDNLVSIDLFNSTVADYQYYSNNQSTYNCYSMVALVKIGDTYSMFPGDLEHDGQKRVYENRNLPRLNFYLVHHHGVQTDDYIPYINAINPVYSIIPNDYSVAINQSLRGIFQKLIKGYIGESGYSDYSFVFDNSSCSVTHGINLPNVGSHSATAVMYVDNSYEGNAHDGTFERPFTSITEAFTFMKSNAPGLSYELNIIGTETPYNGFNLRNIDVPITIKAYNSSNKPTIKTGNIENVKYLTMTDLKFRGVGLANLPVTNDYTSMQINNSVVVMGRCEFDGTDNTNNPVAISMKTTTLRINACTFANYQKVFRHAVVDMFSVVQMSGATSFTNISSYIGAIQNIKYFIYGGCTFTNVTAMFSSSDRPIPPVMDGTFFTPTMASIFGSHVVSEIAYKDTTHPAVIIANNKLYDVLTGTEIT